jgi:CubicO group peptidase (beta-lactamase class C family)
MKRAAWFCAVLIVVPLLIHAQQPRPQPAPAPGFSSERLARIAPVMDQFIKDGKFPGISVTVARNGRIAYRQEFGFADLERRSPLQKDTIYRIYSMTKPITGVAVMMLLEEGRFALDDPVSKYIPCFKGMQVFDSETDAGAKLVRPDREVTIRDLMRHTSGLSYGGTTPALNRLYQSKNLMDPATTLEQMVEKTCSIPLCFQPGTRWEYGVSIDILGRLVEVVSGQPLGQFLQARIFGPLKMVDTGFFVPEEKLGRLAANYSYDAQKGLTAVPPERSVERYRQGGNKLLSGGGGLVSTVSDYLRFATMLAQGGEVDGVRILGPRTVALMRTNQLPEGVAPSWWGGKNGGNGYGLTMSVTMDVAQTTGYGSAGDFGWDGAASTYFRIDPKEHLILLVMTQRMPCDLEIQVKTKALVYQALIGE